IIRENYNGTEYKAQGTVTAVNKSTGAITVSSWDSGSTVPPSGYTVNADVFKWQREYWPVLNNTLSTHMDGITQLTLRVTDGSEGRSIWIDDLRSVDNYLTNPAGSTITSSLGNRYMQYRVISTSSDTNVSGSISLVDLDYTINAPPDVPTLDSPIDTSTGIPRLTVLKTTTTDTESNNLKYKIEICENLSMTTNCKTFDQTSSQTGWSGQNAETSTTYTSGTQATYTLQTPLDAGTTYYWRSYATDPAGSNTWSSTQGTPYSFTTNLSPTIPILNTPLNTATNLSVLPQLRLTSTDVESDYIRYRIKLCTDVAMTVGCQTFDQTSSQTGWSGQDTETSTAYATGTQAIYTQQTELEPSTTYYWAGQSIDPGGSNSFSSYSTPFSFETTNPPTPPTDLKTEALTNPTNILTQTPDFTAIHNDPDGDSALFYQIQVNTASDFSGTSMWDTSKTSTTPVLSGNAISSITYAGTALVFNNTTYYWRIRFWDDGGAEGAWSATGNTFTTGRLNMPQSCYITKAANNSSITLHWTATVSSVDGYTVEKKVNAGAFSNLINLPNTSFSHTDSSVSNGNTYQYRVAATYNGITGNWCTTSVSDLQTGSFLIY
ncbi:fibronectin type III domain-containing protein, partial [Candidatus Dojkabacteria bacterium]|nr:fibronectin type III domain-containing protein [Candidatus Dojkabacteria bacterium]